MPKARAYDQAEITPSRVGCQRFFFVVFLTTFPPYFLSHRLAISGCFACMNLRCFALRYGMAHLTSVRPR
jgi:hypothetical protein